jgi:hypothetical protein
MKQQEGAGAGTVFGLCAVRTMIEIIGAFGNTNKSTVAEV